MLNLRKQSEQEQTKQLLEEGVNIKNAHDSLLSDIWAILDQLIYRIINHHKGDAGRIVLTQSIGFQQHCENPGQNDGFCILNPSIVLEKGILMLIGKEETGVEMQVRFDMKLRAMSLYSYSPSHESIFIKKVRGASVKSILKSTIAQLISKLQ